MEIHAVITFGCFSSVMADNTSFTNAKRNGEEQ